jgi:hypothetical protein
MTYIEPWHQIYTGDQVASVDIDGKRFALTARAVRDTNAWLWTVDFGFQHRSGPTTPNTAAADALSAARAWRREL